jgi:alkylhydroperoxidase family enzyme
MGADVVRAVLEDWQTAPVNEKLRAMLGFLEKVTVTPADITPDDIRPLRAQSLSDRTIQDALLVCTLFNIIDRVADALDFAVPENQITAPFMPT